MSPDLSLLTLFLFIFCFLQFSIGAAERQTTILQPNVATRIPSGSAPDALGRGEVVVPPHIKGPKALATYQSSLANEQYDLSKASIGPRSAHGVVRGTREIRDWEMEDFVLLATVDGDLHARDRKTGVEKWKILADAPVVETTYHRTNVTSGLKDHLPDDEIVWIVEPVEHGALYNYMPERGLQKIPMTMKQLVEDLTPFQDGGRVWSGEKKTTIYAINGKSGKIMRIFQTGGGPQKVMDERCKAKDLDDLEDECDSNESKKTILLGRTEYTATIQRENGELLWTLKYTEWGPNNSDRDLAGPYKTEKPMDSRYVYANHDGSIIGVDRSREGGMPTYIHRLASPVVRVFDVLRSSAPLPSETSHSFVILPQPQLPDQSQNIESTFVGCTEQGGWYALSESSYPFVSNGAPEADCYNAETDQKQLSTLKDTEKRRLLTGRHTTPGQLTQSSEIPRIAALEQYPAQAAEGIPSSEPTAPPPDTTPTILGTNTKGGLFIAIPLILSIFYVWTVGPKLPPVLNRLERLASKSLATATSEPEPIFAQDVPFIPEKPIAEIVTTEPVINDSTAAAEEECQAKEEENDNEVERRAVRFEERPKTPVEETVPEPFTATTPKKNRSHRGKRGKKKPAQASNGEASNNPNGGAVTNSVDNAEIDLIVKRAKDIPKQEPQTPQPDIHVISSLGDLDSSMTQINSLIVFQNQEDQLGMGSQGTIVYKGKFEGRNVAVKRMLRDFVDVAHHEVKLLQNSDDHPNVIRYYCMQQADQFLYIALEQCKASLNDVICNANKYSDLLGLMDPIDVIHQIASGVHHLHSLKIVHRDLKPQNILVSEPRKKLAKRQHPRIMISDFGLCKQLEADQSSFRATTAHAAGTQGWRAPELLVDECSEPRPLQPSQSFNSETTGSTSESGVIDTLSNRRATRAIDIFSMGCVFFYVLTNGSHPFGDMRYSREMNIVAGKSDLEPLDMLGETGYLAKDLISRMVQRNPKARPDAATILAHPLFWRAEKRLAFLLDVSDRFEVEKDKEKDSSYISPHIPFLEKGGKTVIKSDWIKRLDKNFLDELLGNKRRGYDGEKVLDLLRAIRNKKHHYQDMKPAAKASVGALPDGYLTYFTSRYPDLLLHAYRVIKETGFYREPNFENAYYKFE